jgi:hypothetical protein
MGYTHYWNFTKIKGKATETEELYQKAVKDCQKVILAYKKEHGGLAGYSAHTKLGQYGGIDFNGAREEGHENFLLREHFSVNERFNFCKTARKPYDVVVVACLIVLDFHLKDAISVGSDGDYNEWLEGLELARKVLKRKTLTIPKSISLGELTIVS